MHTKNEIIEELYKSREFNECINRMNPEHLRDDLKGEVMLILLEAKEDLIRDLHRTKGLKFYAVRIILNLIQSKTSRFYKMYRQYSLQIADNNAAIAVHDNNDNDIPIAAGKALQRHYGRTHNQGSEEIHDRQRRELMQDQAAAIVEGMYWYDKAIIELYIKLGSYRKIEKETGISWESCYSTVQKAFKKIRNELAPT